MVVQRKMMITESERNRIRSLYEPKKSKDFVFDFVLTENEKYVIIMDQVFVAGGDGTSIGSIWENTYIFNEMINESIRLIDKALNINFIPVIERLLNISEPE